GEGLAALGRDLGGNPLGRFLDEVVDHHPRALPGQIECVGTAETAAGSGDDRHASLENHLSPLISAPLTRRDHDKSFTHWPVNLLADPGEGSAASLSVTSRYWLVSPPCRRFPGSRRP